LLIINTVVLSCKRKEDCIRFALERELFRDKIWLYLLHYKDGKSEIDDPYFFLSPAGRENPKEELITTVFTLLSKPETICRFPARAYYLHLRMNIPFNISECRNLKMFLNYLDGQNISLLYVEQYPLNMSSLFGHLLLKVDYPTCRIINYTADVDSYDILHPFKGLFGYYKGYFSVIPCKEGIEKYVKVYKRKIYRKDIHMNEKELLLVKLHIWELLYVKPSYYFTHRNCASETYHLISFKYPIKHSKSFKAPTDIFGELSKDYPVHRSGKFSLAYSSGGNVYINLRPLYHDLLDKPTGYRRGYEAIISEFEGIYSFQEERLYFNRWTVVKGSYISDYRENPSLSFEISLMRKNNVAYYLYGKAGAGAGLYIKNLTLFTLFFVELYENIFDGYINPGMLLQGDIVSVMVKGNIRRNKGEIYAGIDIHPDPRYSIRIEKEGGGLRLGTGFFF